MKKVKMVQVTPHNWRIENEKGNILQSDITAHSVYEATEFVKRYISSFSNWDYELILLEKYDEN